MRKTTNLYILVLAAVTGMAGLSAHAAPVACSHTGVMSCRLRRFRMTSGLQASMKLYPG